MKRKLPAVLLALVVAPLAWATANYQYQPDEYVVITNGRAPNGQHAIAAHGEGDLGDDNFHLFLMDAKSGKPIGPLADTPDPLDTAADAFKAKWSADSREVAITYRVDRHESVTVRYRIENGRATRLGAPKKSG